MSVVICDVNAAKLTAAKTDLLSKYADAFVLAVQCDVSDQQSVNRMRDNVYGELGEVGFLFCNAGLARDESFSAIHTTVEQWKATMGE